VATTGAGAPHEPQKRWPGVISAPHEEQMRGDESGAPATGGGVVETGRVRWPLAEGELAAPLPIGGGVGMRLRGGGTPNGSPQLEQAVALSGLSASHASHTKPRVIWRES
jgi:hypothetical protein